MTRIEMCHELGDILNSTTLSAVELKDRHPTFEHLNSACSAFSVDTHSLLIGDQNAPKGKNRASNNRATIGERLREFQIEQGFTNRQFARDLGVSISVVTSLVTDAVKPLYVTLFRLHQEYDLDLEWLLYAMTRERDDLVRIDTSHIPEALHSAYPISHDPRAENYKGFGSQHAPTVGRTNKANDVEITRIDLRTLYLDTGSIPEIAKVLAISSDHVYILLRAKGLDIASLKRRRAIYEVVRNFKQHGTVQQWRRKSSLSSQQISKLIQSSGLDSRTLANKYATSRAGHRVADIEKSNAILEAFRNKLRTQQRKEREHQRIEEAQIRRSSKARKKRLLLYGVISNFKRHLNVARWAKAEGISAPTVYNRIRSVGLTPRRLSEKYCPKGLHRSLRSDPRGSRLKLYAVITNFKRHKTAIAWAEAEGKSVHTIYQRIHAFGLTARRLTAKYNPRPVQPPKASAAARRSRKRRIRLYTVIREFKRHGSTTRWAETEGVSATAIRSRITSVGLSARRLTAKYNPRPARPPKPVPISRDRRRRLRLYEVVTKFKQYGSVARWAETEDIPIATIRYRIASVGLSVRRLTAKYNPRPAKPPKPVPISRDRRRRLRLYDAVKNFKQYGSAARWAEAEGVTTAAIYSRVFHSNVTIRQLSRKYGTEKINRHPKNRWTRHQITQLVILNARGLSASKIGEIIGKSRSAVLGKIRRLADEETSSDIFKYRLRAEAGLSLADFAKMVGRDPSTVSQVLAGKRKSKYISEQLQELLVTKQP